MQTAFAARTTHPSPPTAALIEPAAPPKVFIVEPDAASRSALARTVAQAGWHPVMAATAEEFLARARVIAAGCLLVDQDLPGTGGLGLQGRVAGRKEMPVIFMSGRPDIRATVQAMKAGAFDVLLKPLREETLVRVIGQAIALGSARLEEAARLHGLQQCFQELSRREREVLQLVTAGRLNKQVGFDLGISEITVKAHRGSLMRKMHAGSLAELVGMASELRHAFRPPAGARHAAHAGGCA